MRSLTSSRLAVHAIVAGAAQEQLSANTVLFYACFLGAYMQPA